MAKLPVPFPNKGRALGFGDYDNISYTQKSPHQGQDWASYRLGAYGLPIKASGPGVVRFNARATAAGPREGIPSGAHGNSIAIYYPSQGITVHYSHRRSIEGPAVGKLVDTGTVIGHVGDTGKSTGEHLHMEVWRNGVRVNPALYFDFNTVVGDGSSSGGGDTPFNPPAAKEWDEMVSQAEFRQELVAALSTVQTALQAGQGFNAFVIHGTGKPEDSADPRNGVWLFTNAKATQLQQGSVDFLNSWSTTDGRSVASNFDTFVTGGNPGAFDDLKRMFVIEYAPADMDNPDISADVLAVLKVAVEEGIETLIPEIKRAATVDVTALAQTLIENGVAGSDLTEEKLREVLGTIFKGI